MATRGALASSSQGRKEEKTDARAGVKTMSTFYEGEIAELGLRVLGPIHLDALLHAARARSSEKPVPKVLYTKNLKTRFNSQFFSKIFVSLL